MFDGKPTVRRRVVAGLGTFSVAVVAALVSAESARAGDGAAWGDATSRVSLSTSGHQGNDGPVEGVAISADGRFVAFSTRQEGLVPGDTNEVADVFVRDTVNGVTQRVSVRPDGQQVFRASFSPEISANGRFVAFNSLADDLVTGGNDFDSDTEVFVRDRVAGVTRRVSVGNRGQLAKGVSGVVGISAHGRFVAFGSDAANLVPRDTNGTNDEFVRDTVNGTTRRVSVGANRQQANGSSGGGSISPDGRFVVFSSDASNLVPGDTNDDTDAFVRVAGTTQRVSIGTGEQQANGTSVVLAISSGGRFVVFASDASNLVPGDTNTTWDVFVRDRADGVTRRVSVGPGGRQANDGGSGPATISQRGRFVAFNSQASNLVPGDTNAAEDVFVRDTVNGTTRRVSVGQGGQQANGGSGSSAISADGRFVVFASIASNLVTGDTNGDEDVFLRKRGA